MTNITLLLISATIFAQDNAIPITPQPDQQTCWNQGEIQAPDETFEEFIAGVGQGHGIYTNFGPSRSEGTLIGWWTYHVNPNEEIELLLQLYSPEADPQHVRYLLLLDEQPLTDFVSDLDAPFLDVILEQNTLESFNLTLPPLNEGIHEVILVGIEDIETPPDATGTISTFSFRLSLVAGQPSTTINQEIFFQELPAVGRVEENDYQQSLSLTLDDGLVQWSYPEPRIILKEGEPLHFNVLTGYAEPRIPTESNVKLPVVSRFALLVFLDYTQVPISAEHEVLYGQLSRGTAYTRIPISLENLERGIHDILVVKIDNPRIPMCILQGPPDGYSFPRDAVHNRAAVEVLPTD